MIETKILLVDDETVFTDNMSKLLSSRGYRVTAVNSGDAAICELERDEFSVVVLDFRMPGMDGLGVLSEIKRLGLPAQIVILTGHGSIDSAREALELGAFDYLTKPCEIDELVARVESAREARDDALEKDAVKGSVHSRDTSCE